ncbi:hypothetical protein ElyMa_004399800 [Elysia marginata]|uniref:Uncharacterized protein n=1 Tax=Elysia marginata TaxID=1093978 RepID=A0AAV4HA52_9GAST|nr:hypothetical protein ElyMa_004399800 [Elysia marginata]
MFSLFLSDMKTAIDCLHSKPTTCNRILLERELEQLGFSQLTQDQKTQPTETFPQENARTVADKRAKRHRKQNLQNSWMKENHHASEADPDRTTRRSFR